MAPKHFYNKVQQSPLVLPCFVKKQNNFVFSLQSKDQFIKCQPVLFPHGLLFFKQSNMALRYYPSSFGGSIYAGMSVRFSLISRLNLLRNKWLNLFRNNQPCYLSLDIGVNGLWFVIVADFFYESSIEELNFNLLQYCHTKHCTRFNAKPLLPTGFLSSVFVNYCQY